MEKIQLYFALLLALAPGYRAQCIDGREYTYEDHVYCFDADNDQNDFWQALEYCLNDGGSLVSITNYEENQFIQRTIDELAMTYRGYWIGITKYESLNDEYRWTDGSDVTFTSFPDSTTLNDDMFEPKCAFMKYDQFGRWYYGNCGRPQSLICKRPVGDRPPPATLPPPTPVQGYCPEGYFGKGDKCYKAVTVLEADPKEFGVTYETALEICRNSTDGLFPDLASIANEEENAEVTALLYRDEGNFWIGAHLSGGSYVWTDNSPFRYTNWDDSYPWSSTTSGLIHGYHYHSGKWMTIARSSSVRRGYVCQVKKNPENVIPTPAPGPCKDCPMDCPEGYLPYWDSCYRLDIYPRSWSEANNICNSQGGHLVSIHTQIENDAIFMLKKNLDSDENNTWIGMHDPNNEGEYSWSDLWAVTYTHWDEAQPTTPGSCVMMDEVGRWVTDECIIEASFVCKVTKAEPIVMPPKPEGICPPTWIEILGSCYYLHKGFLDWRRARQHCPKLQEDATLAYIHSALENRLVADELRKATTSNTRYDYWIGFYRPSLSGEFIWYNRTDDPVEYVNFVPEDKDLLAYHGVMVNEFGSHRFGKWRLEYNFFVNYVLCKTEKVPASTPPPESPGDCPDEKWVPYGHECLYFVPEPENNTDWNDAIKECKQLGGPDASLATILDIHKNRFIHDHMDIDPSDFFWVGLYNTGNTADTFIWRETGEPLIYTNWHHSQPETNLDMHCGGVFANDGTWRSYYCYEHVKEAYVCQVNKTTDPGQTTEATFPSTSGASTDTTTTSSSTTTSTNTSATTTTTTQTSSTTTSNPSSPTTTTSELTTPLFETPAEGLSTGEIIGIVMGVMFGVGVLVLLVLLLFKNIARPPAFEIMRNDSTRGSTVTQFSNNDYSNQETPA